MDSFLVGDRKIGTNCPAFIVAEMSGNHNQSIDKAIELIHAAKNAGADAIKLQTYTPDTMTLNSNKPDFLIKSDSPWHEHKNLYDLFAKAFLPWEWHTALFDEAKKINIQIFSSPFDKSAVTFLDKLGAEIFKIASPEITDIGLLEACAKTGKPVILSTGVAELYDIELACETLRNNGCQKIVLLKCTASYPAPPHLMNLKTIPDMALRFNCISGLSDHTLGTAIPIASIALGASVIEKHLVLDKNEYSVDSFFSLNPNEFKYMVSEIREVEKALGTINYELDETVKSDLRGRRSLYVCKDIKKGELFSELNIRSIRPAFGLHPKHLKNIINKKSTKNLFFGDRLTNEDIEWK